MSLWVIAEVGIAALLSLGFVFVGVFMVRGIIKAVKGEEILPAEITAEEGRKLLALEKAAREAIDGEPGDDPRLLGLSVALHDLDATRQLGKIKEIEDHKR